MIRKYATLEILEARVHEKGAPKIGHKHTFTYEPRPGYLYVRSRAISSRTNDNYDNFPAEEIAKGYRTFIGKPVFVNHHNDDHRRARGVVIDAALHEDRNPDGSADTWVEVLMEISANKFPKLTQAILAGEIERTSMGVDVAFSVCSVCNHKASTPLEYCQHIPKMKGLKVRRATASGGHEEVLVYEKCISEGSLITTARGQVSIEQVTSDDRVLTRGGWRDVRHVTYMGIKETVVVTLEDGRSVTCTPDHRIATSDGWIEAASLLPSSRCFATTPSAVASGTSIGLAIDAGVLVGVGMPLGAVGSEIHPIVFPMGGGVEDLKMRGFDAGSDSAEMIDLLSGEILAHQSQHSPVDHLLSVGVSVDEAIAVSGSDSSLPDQAVTFTDSAGEDAFQLLSVRSVTHGATVPVYDIGVEGEHEFVADGVLVHNCYGLSFFENSLLVEEPADPTAFTLGVDTRGLEMTPSYASLDRGDGSLGDPEDVGDLLLRELAALGEALAIGGIEEEDLDGSHLILGESVGRVPHSAGTPAFEHHVPRVVGVGPDKEMFGVDAKRRIAGMAHEQASRYGFPEQGVGVTMRSDRRASRIREGEPSIPVRKLPPFPDPALWGHGELGQEAFSLPQAGHPRVAARKTLTFTHPRTGQTYTRTTDADYTHVSFRGSEIAWHGDEQAARRRSSEIYRLPTEKAPAPSGGTSMAPTPSASGPHFEVVTYQGVFAEDQADAMWIAKEKALSEYGSQASVVVNKVMETTSNKWLVEVEVLVNPNWREGSLQGTGRFVKRAMRHQGYGEMTAPAEVDTLREEFCPVCGEADSFDGDTCNNCGYIKPPDEFLDPDLDKAKQVDLHQQTEEVKEEKAEIEEEVEEGVEEEIEEELLEEDESEVEEQPPEEEAPEKDSDDDEDEEDEDEDDKDGKVKKKPPFLKKKKGTQESRQDRAEGRKEMAQTGKPGPVLRYLNGQRRVIAIQGRRLQALEQRNRALEAGLAYLASLAGVGEHVASIVRQGADDENPAQPGGWALDATPPPEPPAFTTEETLGDVSPDTVGGGAVDEVTEPGETSETDVAPDATTSVTDTGTVLDEPLDLNEQDPTRPVEGTDTLDQGERGQAGTNRTETEVRVGDPTAPEVAFSETGWTTGARAFAAQRLARLRIAAGITQGDDLAVAQMIASSDMSDEAIQAEIGTLTEVQKAAGRQRRVTSRRAPRLAERQTPSLAEVPQPVIATAPTDDEFFLEP